MRGAALSRGCDHGAFNVLQFCDGGGGVACAPLVLHLPEGAAVLDREGRHTDALALPGGPTAHVEDDAIVPDGAGTWPVTEEVGRNVILLLQVALP